MPTHNSPPTLYDQDREIPERQHGSVGRAAGLFCVVTICSIAAFLGSQVDAGSDDRHDAIEHTLTQTARALADTSALSVICADLINSDVETRENEVLLGGYVDAELSATGRPYIVIDDTRCAVLDSPEDFTLKDLGFSVHIVSHEIAHARGIENESSANCEAVEIFPDVLEAVGDSSADYSMLVPLHIAQNSFPARYHEAGC